MRRAVQIKIVGHEAIGDAADLQLLDHRMAAFDDLDVGLCTAIRTKLSWAGSNCDWQPA